MKKIIRKLPQMPRKVLILIVIAFILISTTTVAAVYSQPEPEIVTGRINAPTITPMPTVLQPSEKALEVASFHAVRATEEVKIEKKTEHGDKNMSDAELIRRVALGYDADPSMMAYAEAGMKKIIAAEGQPVYYNTYETQQSSPEVVRGNNTNRFQKFQKQQKELEIDRQLRDQEMKMQQLEREAQQRQWDLERQQRAESFDCIQNGGVYSRFRGTCN